VAPVSCPWCQIDGPADCPTHWRRERWIARGIVAGAAVILAARAVLVVAVIVGVVVLVARA
jgi:hypothetical protein